jgi:DNA-binding NarL/FixJ family response regulator
LNPDLVVLDYHLPDLSGLSVAALILAESPATRIVMLTGDPTPEALENAAAIGICAFLPKDGSLAGMLNTLRNVRAGGFLVHPSLVAHLNAQWHQHEDQHSVQALTRRELEVLRLMAEGNDVRANARSLGLSENTCRGYVKSILAKLEVHSQLEAVVSATRRGLIGERRDA